MQSTVEEVKSLLTNTEILNKIIMEEDYTSSDDPEHPERYWKIKRFQYRIDMETLKKPTDEEWNLTQSFQVKTLEEAIAHSILGTTSQEVFIPCSLPEKLVDYWTLHKLDIRESISSKIKWEERRIDRGSLFKLYDIYKGKEIESFEERRWKLNYLLAEIPAMLVKLSEGVPPGFMTSDIMKNDPVKEYPWFMYRGKMYNTTYYFHDQRCVCGDLMKEYSPDYDDEKEDIKVEIWSVDRFYKINNVYVDSQKAFFNGETKILKTEYRADLYDVPKKELKALFPSATWYHMIHGMSSGTLK